ncbi:N-sulphoglucosamine sulphohydrolase-like [Oppia nitens]|uniref:N-sulphoglucosamine sulphohydrolase-like n=1 Tax=Oppia nitens TaxID=1686743 RepID=UPI0023DAB17A|nr:N-sulphoglucosamine sulphohydrolase-like [Oppia nitens]
MCSNIGINLVLAIICINIIANSHCIEYNVKNANNVIILFADDAGLETPVYNNTVCKTPNIENLAKRSVIFTEAFTSVSSCSPSRSTLLTGLPSHQNGMYGLHQSVHNFNSFDSVKSLPNILSQYNIRTGIIGKKHVGPQQVYTFDFEYTEENYPINQIARNITNIKNLVHLFLNDNDTRPFLLYIAFHDPHRCGHITPQFGNFCEKFGNGEKGMGLIPDWKPVYYSVNDIKVAYYLPDTRPVKEDISAQYTTISRLDQGIGLIINELQESGLLNNTLIIYSSDNGPPFPMGRTNLYDPGVREPLLISNPLKPEMWNKHISTPATLLDVVPTILDWFDIPIPKYKLFGKKVYYTGKSLLPYTAQDINEEDRDVYGSHTFHEITMYYPMRSIRTSRYKLIHNINHYSPYGIDQDLYLSPTFQYILNRTHQLLPIYWFKTLQQYYYRQEFELFDLKYDSIEAKNIYSYMKYNNITKNLKNKLKKWRTITNDPFICSPHYVLQDTGDYKSHPKCLPLFNQKIHKEIDITLN